MAHWQPSHFLNLSLKLTISNPAGKGVASSLAERRALGRDPRRAEELAFPACLVRIVCVCVCVATCVNSRSLCVCVCVCTRACVGQNTEPILGREGVEEGGSRRREPPQTPPALRLPMVLVAPF